METPFSISKISTNTPLSQPRRKVNKRSKQNDTISSGEAKQLINRTLNKSRVIKYFDSYLASTNSTTTLGYAALSLVPQGIGQSQRLADTLWITSIDWRMNATTANADIFATMRWGIFIWKQNTTSVTPGAGSILESTATYGTLSPLNFEGRLYYSIITDECVSFTGTASNPTTGSQLLIYNNFRLNGHRCDYELAATTGTGLLYFFNVSDSAIVPHPVYTYQCRIWYYDE